MVVIAVEEGVSAGNVAEGVSTDDVVAEEEVSAGNVVAKGVSAGDAEVVVTRGRRDREFLSTRFVSKMVCPCVVALLMTGEQAGIDTVLRVSGTGLSLQRISWISTL